MRGHVWVLETHYIRQRANLRDPRTKDQHSPGFMRRKYFYFAAAKKWGIYSLLQARLRQNESLFTHVPRTLFTVAFVRSRSTYENISLSDFLYIRAKVNHLWLTDYRVVRTL